MMTIADNGKEKVTALAQMTQPITTYFPTESDWRMMYQIGDSAIKSGMLPTAIKTTHAAAIIALKARELGIPVMMGFTHIHIINGKPTLSAELMQGLARKNLPGLLINIIESSSELASIEFLRPEKGSRPFKISFSLEDAKKAELLNKAVWKQYPRAMLWSRCVSAGLRTICPEALMGISYTPEEMGAEVDESGEPTIVVESRKIDDQAKAISPPPQVKPPADRERLKILHRLTLLQKELSLEPEDIAQEIVKEFPGSSSTKELATDQLLKLVAILQETLDARKQIDKDLFPPIPNKEEQEQSGFDKF